MADAIVWIPEDRLKAMRRKTQAEVDAAARKHDACDLKPAERRTYAEGSEAA